MSNDTIEQLTIFTEEEMMFVPGTVVRHDDSFHRGIIIGLLKVYEPVLSDEGPMEVLEPLPLTDVDGDSTPRYYLVRSFKDETIKIWSSNEMEIAPWINRSNPFK